MKRIVYPAKIISACEECDYFRSYEESIVTPEGYYKKAEPDCCLNVHHPTIGGPREIKDSSKIQDWCPLECIKSKKKLSKHTKINIKNS